MKRSTYPSAFTTNKYAPIDNNARSNSYPGFFPSPNKPAAPFTFTIAPAKIRANNNPTYLTPKPIINNIPPTNSTVATYARPPGKPM